MVNAIASGFFATNIGGGHAKQRQVQEMSKVIPIHRVGFATTSSAWHYFWYRRPANLDGRWLGARCRRLKWGR